MPTKTAKKKVAKKTSNVKKGERYECTTCGLVVAVDEICGCMEAHEIICCGKAMKKKR
ncbi:MAG: hypothetical protein N2257_07800 [Thermodesulfovibrionales bacterium]|nr:hypothetical protein [Thermodesulfovibrionales bacterium]